MPIAIIFPKVSLETDVGTIARWLKDDGAPVRQGEARGATPPTRVGLAPHGTSLSGQWIW